MLLEQAQLTFGVHFSPVAGYRPTDSFFFPCWFMTACAPLLICSLWQHYHPFLVLVCAFLRPSLWIGFGSATSVWLLYLHLCRTFMFLLFLSFPTCTILPSPSSVPSWPSTRGSPVEGQGFLMLDRSFLLAVCCWGVRLWIAVLCLETNLIEQT